MLGVWCTVNGVVAVIAGAVVIGAVAGLELEVHLKLCSSKDVIALLILTRSAAQAVDASRPVNVHTNDPATPFPICLRMAFNASATVWQPSGLPTVASLFGWEGCSHPSDVLVGRFSPSCCWHCATI